ncbi:MAG TPA: valine--tRNA ligase [Baekduia sp.]|nr:valine--tRNA ligase [Baekduia sp.]
MSLADRKRYEPSEVEPRIAERWLHARINSPAPEGDSRDNYSIAVPPPNVTGALHMGHALNGTVQDALVRFHRARGKNTKWILGTDHAGIATQTQVEKLLVSEGSSREEIGRDEFLKRVWTWRDQYGGTIIEQFKALGASLDYEDERFTFDEAYAQAVLKVFVDLYEDGLIYRDNYMVNWDPGSGSAISDLEVEEREVTDSIYEIAYPLADGDGELIVATVRPETMLGDTAIAVNPADERYTHLIGRTAILPLVGRELPIIADEYVKTDFGTGALKITPGHDPNDFELGRKHGLAEISVIGEDGRMNENAGEFAGQTVTQARAAIVERLAGAVRGVEPHVHTVPFSHRSGERIEPLISLQWFMRMDELAGPAIDVVRDGRVTIHPPSQSRRYVDWLENIRPWCVSRQLWWGHQLPVWYRGEETYVGATEPEGDGWVRDADVLDTWFSSALWPFATLGWPEDDPRLRAFYPTDVLSTARDILFLWVARMVMMGLRFTGDVPFADVYIHSVIQSPDGRRMSKSLGTGIDPMDLITGGPRPPVFKEGGDFPAYGADAVRFGLMAMSSTQDVRFSEEKVAQGQALANKLFNATRFVLMNVAAGAKPRRDPQTIEDRWIASRLLAARADFEARVQEFDFSKAAFGLYDFVYGELCDWYLELIKGRDFDARLSGHLLYVLRETLALAHPLIPFVTEELWDNLPGTDGLLAAHQLSPERGARDEQAEAEIAQAIAIISAVRTWRESAGVKPGEMLQARASGIAGIEALVAKLARLKFTADGAPAVATIPVAGTTIELLTGVDPEEAARKTAAERSRLEGEIKRAAGKLENAGFVAKAPADVVEAERQKLDRLRADLEAL